mmetsp:Transcript_1811/g.4546  ORF Transcript_1811/g.4546 Transcript_1811/m.4546 type:complete len:382 (-) Transcript_1811:45-1190(-)
MQLPEEYRSSPAVFAVLRRLQQQGVALPDNFPELVELLRQQPELARFHEQRDQRIAAAAQENEQVLQSLDLHGIAQYIQSGKAKNIIVMVGAGLSTAAGIPDFRTPGTGLYDNLQKYALPYPEAIFSLDFFRESPGAFYELINDLWPGNYKPTKAHHFIKLLADKGLLKRCYTQNIDSLEELAGVDRDLVVAAHGNFSAAHGIDTHKEVPIEELKEAVQDGQDGWQALRDKHRELVKPDIVFFGESLPERFTTLIRPDFQSCDLLIVMGTSLVVAPFCKCITLVSKQCPRLLINREPVGLEAEGFRNGFRLSGEENNYRDAYFCGDCDEGVETLCQELAWTPDLRDLVVGPAQEAGGASTAVQLVTKCSCISGLWKLMAGS